MSKQKFERCIRKLKNKSKGKLNPYAICRASTKYFKSTRIKTVFDTSQNDGHSHIFRTGNKLTRINYGHLHPIDYKKGIAEPTLKSPHSHKIPKTALKVLKLLQTK